MKKKEKTKRMGAPVRLPQADTPLARYRAQSGLSQSQIGDKLGITRGMVSQVERGLTTPSQAVQKLIDLLLAGKI